MSTENNSKRRRGRRPRRRRSQFPTPQTLKHQRDAFYERVLPAAALRPSQFMEAACGAWQEVLNGVFAELWLHNEHTEAWELLHTTERQPRRFASHFADRNADGSRPIVDLCCDKGAVAIVKDLDFKEKFKEETYALAIRRAGLEYFHCIPIVSPKENGAHFAAPNIPLRAAICVHHRHPGRSPDHSLRTLNLMANITSLSMLRCYESEQRDVLLALNALNERYAANGTLSPRECRAQYASDLVSLVRDTMNAVGVTLFYRSDDPEAINCLATTGLVDAHRVPVPPSRVERCRYHVSEPAWTTECYKRGTAKIATPDETARHRWKYTESDSTNGNRPPGKMGAVILPILRRTQSGDDESFGVLRCSGFKKKYGTRFGAVNTIGYQTLTLIAQQVGPFLESLAGRIKREETISLLKHDMQNPLNLIWNTVDRLETLSFARLREERMIKFNDLMNIKWSAQLARTMLPQFSFDPGDVKTFTPTLVSIERDVVAYLKEMFKYSAKREKGIDITFASLAQIPELYVDKLLVERTLHNVIVNAIKYGHRDSTVAISGGYTAQYYYVNISNVGIGVDDGDVESIFELGFRAHKAIPVSLGNGHGLYVARKAMRKHGGDVVLVHSRAPTVFSLRFPQSLSQNKWWTQVKS